MTPADRTKAFLGIGWSYPFAMSGGNVSVAVYEEDVRQATTIILGVNLGERVMRPDFGADLGRFVFQPVTPTLLETIRTRVEEALIDWEPRISVEQVKVTSDPADRARVLIEVRYKVRATNTQANLVYPFYLQEGGSK
jgi:hypothetical protein